MAPYRDRTFDPTPFAGSIGDLILRSAEAPARAAEIIAQAQARAAEVKGQAWAQAGQAIGNIPTQIQQVRDANVERQARQAQLADADAQRQQAIEKRTKQLLGNAFRTSKTPDEAKDSIKYLVHNGLPAEAGATAMALVDAAGPDGYSRVQQHFLDLMNAELPIEKYSEGQIGVQGFNADGTPNIVAQGPQKPVEPPKAPAIGSFEDYVVRRFGQQPTAEQITQARKDYETADDKPPAGPAVGSFEDFVVKKFGANPTADQLAKARREWADLGREIKPEAETVPLTPAGLDAAAMMFAKTGQLPPMGMGASAAAQRAKIINRAAELDPSIDLAAAKADYDANRASLSKLQQQRDAIGAFEETALKNLDIFIEQAKKISDTGSPMLNRPLRAIQEAGLGSAELTAFNTARRTVIPEFAKILANPGLSGQLSDSARHEIEEVISGNATLKQTLAAADILKRDARNRRESYDDQIAAIRARLSKADAKATDGETTKDNDPMGIR